VAYDFQELFEGGRAGGIRGSFKKTEE